VAIVIKEQLAEAPMGLALQLEVASLFLIVVPFVAVVRVLLLLMTLRRHH
jgi:hypothetical protein